MSMSMKNKKKNRRKRRRTRKTFQSYRANMKTPFKQGEIVIIDDVTEKGSHLKNKSRPVVVVSNNLLAACSPCLQVVKLTHTYTDSPARFSFYMGIDKKMSVAVCDEVISIDKFHCIKTGRHVSRHTLYGILECIDWSTSPDVRE